LNFFFDRPALTFSNKNRKTSLSASSQKYDLIVIGSGPAGENGAAQAAYFGKRVALVEKEDVLGGAAANAGTIASKTLREIALTFHDVIHRRGGSQQKPGS